MTEKKTRIISNLLCFAVGIGFGIGCYRISEKLGGKFDTTLETESPTETAGGAVLNVTDGNGLKLTAAKLASSEYEANAVSSTAENAYTLTATVTPSDAANQEIDWSIAFKNAGSAWAISKTVTDYVTVTPSSDGALTAVVACTQAFGEQIIVTATSRSNANAYATCTVDYEQRVYTYNLAFDNNGIDLSSGTELSSSHPTGTVSVSDSEQSEIMRFFYNGSDTYTVKIPDNFTFDFSYSDSFKSVLFDFYNDESVYDELDELGVNVEFIDNGKYLPSLWAGSISYLSNGITLSNFFGVAWLEGVWCSEYVGTTYKDDILYLLLNYSGVVCSMNLYVTDYDEWNILHETKVAVFDFFIDMSGVDTSDLIKVTLDESNLTF